MDTSPTTTRSSAVAGLIFVVFFMTAGHTSTEPANVEEQDVLLTGPRGYTRHNMPEDHTVRLWLEAQGASADLALPL